jgi:hypothetical protein
VGTQTKLLPVSASAGTVTEAAELDFAELDFVELDFVELDFVELAFVVEASVEATVLVSSTVAFVSSALVLSDTVDTVAAALVKLAVVSLSHATEEKTIRQTIKATLVNFLYFFIAIILPR